MKDNKASKTVAKDAKVSKETTKDKAPVEGVKVAEIARKHGLNPKVVRSRLRRLYRNEDTRKGLPTPVSPGTWTFREADRKAVEALVTATVTEE